MKNFSNINDHNLRKDFQILVIYGTDISDATGY